MYSRRKSGPRPTWSMPATSAMCSMWSTTRSSVGSSSSTNIGRTFIPITPPVAAIAAQVLVAEVAVVIAQRPGARVRRDDDAVRELEHVVDRRRREVRDVEEDPEPLELCDRAHARRGKAAARLLVRGAFREQRARPVRERDHAHAEPVEDREQLDVGADPRRSLERDEQRDLPVGERRVDVGAGAAERDLGRLRRLALERLELEQRRAQRRLRDLRRDVDRQHLHVHAAGARLGNPALAPVALRALIAELAVPQEQEHRQVVVRVDDDGVL